MQTYCQPVFVAPFCNVTSISVVGFHVEVAFAHIPPTEWGSTFSSRGPRTIQIIENVDIIQIIASVHRANVVPHSLT